MAANGIVAGSAQNQRTVAQIGLRKSNELDEFLNDIFDDTAGTAESSVRERTLAKTWGTREKEFRSPQGCVSTQDDGGQTVLTWQTSQEGPRKCVTVSKETVKRPSLGTGRQDAVPVRFTDERSLLDVVDGRRFQGPPSYQESRTLQTHTETKTKERLLSPVFRRPVDADLARVPPAPPSRRRVISPEMMADGGKVLSHSDISSPPFQGFSSSTAAPQKRSAVSIHRNYASDSEEALTWLEDQKRKLELKRATGRIVNYHRQQQQHDRSKSSTDFTRSVGGTTTRGPGLPQSDTDDFVNPTKSGIHPLKSSLSEDSLSRTQGKSRAGCSRTLEPPRFTKDYGGGNFSRFKPVESRRRWDDDAVDNRGREDRRFYDVSSIQRPSSATPHTKYSFTMPGPSSSSYDEFGRWVRPAGLSAPTSPVIPARGISSRDAVVRSKGMAREWFAAAAENATYDRLDDAEQTLRKGTGVHLTAPLKPVPTEAERISLLPIGRGVQDLEPGGTSVDGGTLDFRRSTPTLNRTNQGDYAQRNQELRSKSSLGRSSAYMTSPASQRRDLSYATMPISTTGHASELRDSSSVFAPIQRPSASLGPAPPSGDSTTYQAERRMYSETVRGSLPGSGQLGYDAQQHGHVLSNAGQQQQQATNRQLVTQQWLQQQPLSQQQQQFSQQEVQYRQQIQQQHQLKQQQEQQFQIQEQQRQLQLQQEQQRQLQLQLEQQRQLQLQEEQRLLQLQQEQQRQLQLQEQQRQLQLQEEQRMLQLQQEQQRQLQLQEQQRQLQLQEQQRQLQLQQEQQRHLQLQQEQQRQLQLQEQQRQLQLQEEQRLLHLQQEQQRQLQEQQRQLQLQEEQRQLQLKQEQQRQLQLQEQQRQLQLQEEQRQLQLKQEQQRQLQLQEQQRQLQLQEEQRLLQLQQEQQRQLQIQEQQRQLQLQEQQRQLQLQEQQKLLQLQQEQQRQFQLQQEQQRQLQLQEEQIQLQLKQDQQRQLQLQQEQQRQQQQQQFHSQTIQRMYVVEQKTESRNQPISSQTLDSRVGETSFSSAQPVSQFAFRESSSFVEPHRSTISDAAVQANSSSSSQFTSEQRSAQQGGSADQTIEVSQAIGGHTAAAGQVGGIQIGGRQVGGIQAGGNQVGLNQVGGNQVGLNQTGGQVIEQRYVVERQVIGRGQTGSQASSISQVGGQGGVNQVGVQQPAGGQVIEQRYIVEREVIGKGQGGQQRGTNLSQGQGALHANQAGGQMTHAVGSGHGAYQAAYQGGTQTGMLQASHQQGDTYKTVEKNSWVQSSGTQEAGAGHREQQGVRFGVADVDSKALSGTGGFSERVEVMSAERGGQQQQQQQQHQQQQQQHQSYGYEFQQMGEQGRDGSVWTLQRGVTNDGRSISAASAASHQGIGSINPGGSWTLRPDVSRTGIHQRNASGSYVNAPKFSLSGTRTSSDTCITDGAVWSHQPPRFVRDTSKFWHKPNISRDDAIGLLLDKEPGSFVVRSSSTFPGSFGLALKVSQVPPNMQTKGGDPQIDLIRHFLIEPTPKGVRLKGCSNEPVFASLAALIYQHSVTPLSLPCKLKLPDEDIDTFDGSASLSGPDSQQNGAACTVLFMGSVETENLTGPEALARSIKELFESGRPLPRSTIVQFKVTRDGITLTDNRRRIFFRRFYPIQTITFCGADARDRRWTVKSEDITISGKAFGFVARKPGAARENACHVFLELDPTQPANVIVNFVTKVIIGQGQRLLQ